MAATIIKWLIVLMSAVNAAYMAFDGSRALIKGDYLRPQSGEYAGQLGPWSKLVTKLGIDPMSPLMKSVFLLYGITGLLVTAGFAFGAAWGWKAMLIYNITCLWNLFFGTASSLLQIVLLILLKLLK